jgi:hypothetical protein
LAATADDGDGDESDDKKLLLWFVKSVPTKYTSRPKMKTISIFKKYECMGSAAPSHTSAHLVPLLPMLPATVQPLLSKPLSATHHSLLYVVHRRSRGSSVSIVPDYGLEGRGSIPDRGVQTDSGYRGLFPRG